MRNATAVAQTPANNARPKELARTTAAIVRSSQAVNSNTLSKEVFAIFEAEADLVSLPVIENERPIGLINRNIFMQSMARPFHREIYLNKTCIAFMDKEPLIVDQKTSIEVLSFMVLEAGNKVLVDGFIVTDDDRYVGVGLAHDMLQAVADLQAEKNHQVMESIHYGSVIQKSLSRASRDAMSKTLTDHFLLWQPRDVVSGDFFHFQDFTDGFLLIHFDCTGHGVPGAFMTLIMSSFIQGALSQESAKNPAELIAAVNRRVKTAMGQVDYDHSAINDGHGDASDDGMDAAFCWVDKQTRQLTFAGAHLPMFILDPASGDIATYDGDRHGVGYATTAMDQQWTNQVVDLPAGACVYFFTDGYFDQLGGDKRIAFGKRRTRELIQQHHDKPMPEQSTLLYSALLDYQGLEQRKDDVCAIGFRI